MHKMSSIVSPEYTITVRQQKCKLLQELQLFLEKEGQLDGDPEWAHLQPATAGVLDGLHRLPRQLLGALSALMYLRLCKSCQGLVTASTACCASCWVRLFGLCCLLGQPCQDALPCRGPGAAGRTGPGPRLVDVCNLPPNSLHARRILCMPVSCMTALGAQPSVPSVAEAAQSTRRTGDLLRRIKEQTTSMKHHPPPSEAELDLLVSLRPIGDDTESADNQICRLRHWCMAGSPSHRP